MEPFAAGFAIAGIAASGLATIYTGIGYGFDSSEFWTAAGNTALELFSFGASRYVGGLDGLTHTASTIGSSAAHAVSPVFHALGDLF